jgi:Raf kinase inhibitor-like YbhB/YbcL family protein
MEKENDARQGTRVKERPPRGLLEVTSSSFGHGQRLPSEHARGGENRSPILTWSRVPRGTRTFALLCEDPDAPRPTPFVHWVLYNVPGQLSALPEAISKSPQPEEIPGALQGMNHFDEIGYAGPDPPKGHGTHHYHFKVFALDTVLDRPAGLGKTELLRALEGHILATGDIVGTYSL